MTVSIRARLTLPSLALVSLVAPTAAQMQPGDLLLNSFSTPDILVHYRPDGTVVQTTGAGTGSHWAGAAILPNGDWVTTHGPPYGVNIFDGVSGAEIAAWDMPSGLGYPGDVGVFSDGTLAIVEQKGKVWRYDSAGNVIASWSVSGHPFGILVDDQDHVWTCDISSGVLWHTDDNGNKISEFSIGSRAGDVTMAKDGTLFVTRPDTIEVAHYAQDGTFLGAFKATGSSGITAIAMGQDQTLWVSGEQETLLRNFDQAGNLLGSFDVGPAAQPTFLTILVIDAEDIGTNYCGPGQLNSSGQAATISAFGSEFVLDNYVRLDAVGAAPHQSSMFINSPTQGLVIPPGSQGFLCLGGAIGRYTQNIMDTGASGAVTLKLDLSNTPTPNGSVAIQPGDTWNFQLWFRDQNPGATSNFTDGVSITFL